MKYLLHGEETERLKFQSVSKDHFKLWLPFFETFETTKYWKQELLNPKDACKQWYKKQAWRNENDLGGMNALFCKRTRQLIGYAGLLIQTVDGKSFLEIAYSLLPQFWNNGYATEAALKCKEIAEIRYNVLPCISIISVSNIPSQRVAEKLGFGIQKKTTYKDNEVYLYGNVL